MAISPGGERVYVTARNSNAVLAFDTSRLISDPEHARLATVPVGAAPVPVAVIDGDRKVVAGNSNRIAGATEPQTLTVLDAGRMQEGVAATLGTIPVGAFPREMAVSADGRTLFVTNFGSRSGAGNRYRKPACRPGPASVNGVPGAHAHQNDARHDQAQTGEFVARESFVKEQLRPQQGPDVAQRDHGVQNRKVAAFQAQDR